MLMKYQLLVVLLIYFGYLNCASRIYDNKTKENATSTTTVFNISAFDALVNDGNITKFEDANINTDESNTTSNVSMKNSIQNNDGEMAITYNAKKLPPTFNDVEMITPSFPDISVQPAVLTKRKLPHNMISYLTPKPFKAPSIKPKSEYGNIKYITKSNEKSLQVNNSLTPKPSNNNVKLHMPKDVRRSNLPWLKRNSNSGRNSGFDSVCSMSKDKGKGRERFSSWYYNAINGRCEWFTYKGSGGNGNRFNYRGNCEDSCVNKVNQICTRSDLVYCEPTWLRCQMVPDTFCIRQLKSHPAKPSFLFCPPPQPMCVYGNSQVKPMSSLSFRKPPIYPTHRHKVPQECREQKDRGPCNTDNNSILRYFYNPRINDCLGFLYSKCGGNSNRFSTKEECMNHCAY